VLKDEKPKFEIKICIENNTEIKSIEHELRSKLQSVSYPIYSLKQSFDDNVIRFISTDPVSRYVNHASTSCPYLAFKSDNACFISLVSNHFAGTLKLLHCTAVFNVSLTVSKEKQHFCKQLLQSLQNELEEKFHVNLNENENNIKYGWVIKGGKEYAQSVYNKMKALVDDVCTKSQCYQVDFGCLDIEMDILS
jgi:hypothetical protein